ncbi:AAA family ATPase [Lysinibacillus sp. G4S2]|uniref:AAA family ATPase n=1 Tax=Lysinibacillus sp. G4S2 TaxID=3055859 RepID=UPI0025A2C083|nr:AAA family ATPase [Lysinibacillus sp. G4S2]MDM5248807.1 AAA family ATPase [Lysinibacillus sp. G4S2]
MIPYRLQFSGIRDYKPTRILFGQANDHILITGPNGTGKSTISFCMGAVLYSSKIDLEGLRSNNLPSHQKWRAMVELTFKNEGPSRIDAAPFVSFRLMIEQDANRGVLQREYHVLTGETEDELTVSDIYRSGDANQRNFTTYKEDLQFKYKIDSDLFYLIWYQQEVNQFAVMAPEERFRRFSEMHNITEIQQSWETAIEGVKELEQELVAAKTVVKQAEFNLKIAKEEFDRLKNNKARLYEAGKAHILNTMSLMQLYNNQKLELVEKQKKQTDIHQDTEGKIGQIKKQIEKAKLLLQDLNKKQLQMDEEKRSKSTLLEQFSKKRKTLILTEQELKVQLIQTEEQRKQLRFTEDITKVKFNDAQKKIAIIEQQYKQLQQQFTNLVMQKDELNENRLTLKWELEKIEKEEQEAIALLAEHTSAHQVQQKITHLEEQIQDYYKKKVSLEQKLENTTIEITQRENNQIYSARQLAGLQQFKQRDISAYTFRDLVTLAEGATIEHENRLNSIKYTIFYDAKERIAFNDLYHVSLRSIVPERLTTSLPVQKLVIRQGLSEKEQNFAVKALWWAQQFFEIQAPKIQGELLVDEHGYRGTQEKNTVILNDKMLTEQLHTMRQLRAQLESQLLAATTQFKEDQINLQKLNSIIKDVQKAEASVVDAEFKHHKVQYKTKLDEQFTALQKQEIQLTTALQNEQEKKIANQFELEKLKTELDIYEQLGALKKVQEQLTETKLKLIELNAIIDESNSTLNQLKDESYKLHDVCRQKESDIRLLKSDLRDAENDVYGTKKLLLKYQEEFEVAEASILQEQLCLEELATIIPDIFAEVQEVPLSLNSTIPKLKSDNTTARINFENARAEKVNPEAERNYIAVKDDFNLKKETVDQTQEYLEIHRNRALENENRLETTINMNVLKINNLFSKYMDEFQFEGKIEYERFEDKKGRTIFKLYIKARKIGHSGRLEDVGTKARHGKLGKGVSGGEESLSSLLFALALLQNLNTSPSFIVLDEFDSALDEERKEKVFDLYVNELQRKLIILSPKAHDDHYYNKFSTVVVVEHDSAVPISRTKTIRLLTH